MNLLRFLKSTKGAIKTANALALSGAAAVGFFFVANTAANRQIQAERQVRSLASISQVVSPQEGMRRQGGMLTSINVRDARNQIASNEEIAARQGNDPLSRYAANQRALDNMEGALGRAAEFSDADGGLNTGNRDVIQEAARYSVGNPNGVNAGDVTSNIYQAREQAAAGQNQLAPASMARASGQAVNNSAGPISSGNSGAGNGGIVSGEGPRRLSGAMPGGSNIVSQMGLDHATARANNTASFGRDRNGRGSGGRRIGNERNEVKDILKKSAAAAANTNASATEGSKAFLANAQTSGGITVDGPSDGNTASSADLTNPTKQKLKAVGNRLNQEQNKQEERNKKHRALIAQLIATAAGSIAMMIAGSLILSKMDDRIAILKVEAAAEPHNLVLKAELVALQIKRWLIAAGMIAAVGAANAWLFVNAKKFVSDYGAYGGTFVATIAQIVAVLSVGAAVQTALKPKWKEFIKNAWRHMKSMFNPLGLFMPKI